MADPATDEDAIGAPALRDGDVETFAREYQRHGLIVAAPTASDVREALVRDWVDAHSAGDHALMIAHRRHDVAELNARARELLREDGRLGQDELVTAESAFAVGDRVIAGRNDIRHDVVNGQAGTLMALDAGHLIVAFDGGEAIRLPRAYAEPGNLGHAYAITAHRSQGATVDRTFVLGSDDLYREWGYTALSRHRDEARFYVGAAPAMLNEQRSPLRDEDAADEAARVLSATRAQQLALRGLPHDQVADRLAHELQRARECADRNAAQLHEIEELHARTPWYRRGERAQLDVRRASGTSGVVHWDAEVRRLEQDIADRAPVLEPQLWRAIDPLPDRGHGLDRAPGAHELPQVDLGRDIGHDVGIDL